jgi:hypothetical protein
MQTKEFAMLRKTVLAVLLAVVISAGSPVWASPDGANSASNIGRGGSLVNSEIAGLDSTPMQLAPEDMPSTLSSSGSGANDSLAGFGPSSGTMVGNRAQELRDEVLRLRSSVNLNASEFMVLRSNGAAGAVQYHSTVAAITARLQNGTTRGNPILLRQWEEAEASLNEVTNSLNRLNALQTSVSADASLASYMMESVQAGFLLSGAVDEDHDQLRLLRDEVSRLIVQLDYLRNQVADDIQRQTVYLTTERGNLQALAFAITRGELLGSSMASRPVIVNPSPVMSLPPQTQGGGFSPTPSAAPIMPVTSSQAPNIGDGRIDPSLAPTTGRLLVLIRFNQSNVEYEQQLSAAVSTVLQHKPQSEFSVVAVAPLSGDPSELAKVQEESTRRAETVKRALVQLGLAPSRIVMGSTQTVDAKSAEVHVYVR